MKFSYVATAEVSSPVNAKLRVDAGTYFDLCKQMHDKAEFVRYYTHGVNSYQTTDEPFQEAYTKDLIWPEIHWVITREERKDG